MDEGELEPARWYGAARWWWFRVSEETKTKTNPGRDEGPAPNWLDPAKEGNWLDPASWVLSGMPDISVHERTYNDDFLILACDGIFGGLSTSVACSYVRRGLQAHESHVKTVHDQKFLLRTPTDGTLQNSAKRCRLVP